MAETGNKRAKSPKIWSTADFFFGSILGSGLDGRVYHARFKASPPSIPKDIAIKVIDKFHIQKTNRVKNVMTERNILSRLSAQNCVWTSHLFMTYIDNYHLYFVLELCTKDLSYIGLSDDEISGKCKNECNDISVLHDKAKGRGVSRVSVETKKLYFAQIICAVEYLHSHDIIHFDLKPENIMVTAHSRIKLIDFGSAIELSSMKDSSISDIPFEGTADYVSPEVIRGKFDPLISSEGKGGTNGVEVTMHDAGRAIDIWAVGCLLYFLLEGKSPFHSGTDHETFQKIVSFDERHDCICWSQQSPVGGVDLVQKILKKHWSERPSFGHQQYTSIRTHEFMCDIQWDHLKSDSSSDTNSKNPHQDCMKENDMMHDGAKLGFDF